MIEDLLTVRVCQDLKVVSEKSYSCGKEHCQGGLHDFFSTLVAPSQAFAQIEQIKLPLLKNCCLPKEEKGTPCHLCPGRRS